VIDGSTSTIGLDPATTIWDDTVVGDLDALTSETHLSGTTTYGGLFLALANQYNTDLQFQFGGAICWEFFGAQSESSIAYAHDVGGQPTCDVYVSSLYTVPKYTDRNLAQLTEPDTLFNKTPV
jgi:hypothetical protein